MKPEIQAPPRPERVLSCWKDIANYLHRDVRTVQRWERSRGLPVHRLPGQGKNAVYALPTEIDSWWAGTPARQEKVVVVSLPVSPARRRAFAILVGVALVAALGFVAWLLGRRTATPLPLASEVLTSLPGAELYPSLSADGRRLVFSWIPPGEENYDLYMMNLPAGKPERLTTGPGLHLFSEWSPDGSTVAYIRLIIGAERLEVRLVDANTRKDTLLFVEPLIAVSPPAWALTWTRGGDQLILSTPGPDSQRIGLSLHDIASGRRTRLTDPERPDLWDILPAVSPDGRSLVFLRRKIAGDGNIFRQDLNPDGLPKGPARQITREECCVDSPSWSADGKEVIFLSRRGGTLRLMRVDARGGAARPDTAILVTGTAPRVGSNGWLVTWDEAPANRVMEVPLRGGAAAGPARELIASSRRDGAPAFSPDGKQIVFQSNRSGSWQLWVCGRDGTAVRQLTKLDGVHPSSPDWSPRGKLVAFEGRVGDVTAVYVADIATGKHWRVTGDGMTARLPRWSRNGNSLYVASDRTGRYEAWRIDLDGSGQPKRTSQVTREGGFSGMESPDGRFIYYSKYPTVKSIWRVPSVGGKEEEVIRNFGFNRYPANVAAGPEGLYFRGQGRERGEWGFPIWMLPFTGGPPRRVMDEPGMPSPQGIAVSPDGHSLLLSTVTYPAGDVFAYKKFK